MFENIIIGISVVAIIWGSIFSFRLDNVGDGSSKHDEHEGIQEEN